MSGRSGVPTGLAHVAGSRSDPMDVHEALDAWQAQYSGQPPVGFMLRFTHEAVWTRVHYLRDSSEPATREEDQRTASRFDAVASALFTGTTVLVLAIHLDPGREATAELRDIGAAPHARDRGGS